MENKTTVQKFNRFLNIHKQLYLQTLELLKDVPDEVFKSTPIDNEVMYLGTRVNTINIGGLIRHFVLAEIHWFQAMKEGENGLAIPKPDNASLLENIADGQELVEKYKDVFAKGFEILKSYTEEDLNKTVSFMGRKYTVMAFLWITFGHHSYHLGQVDMLMRQNGIYPAEYMEWPNTSTLIG